MFCDVCSGGMNESFIMEWGSERDSKDSYTPWSDQGETSSSRLYTLGSLIASGRISNPARAHSHRAVAYRTRPRRQLGFKYCALLISLRLGLAGVGDTA